MKATHIIWDIDKEEEDIMLPAEVELPEGMTDEDEISDYLSDQTGFCHKGFQLEELTGAIPEAEAKKLIENGEAVLYSSYPIAIQRKEGRS